FRSAIRILNSFADVAELADAQVSEACDGDIVEVQVLSSAPEDLKGESFDSPFFNGAHASCVRVADILWARDLSLTAFLSLPANKHAHRTDDRKSKRRPHGPISFLRGLHLCRVAGANHA